MSKFLARRLALRVLTLFLVSVVEFAATQALPGSTRPSGAHAVA